ncbi:MAG: YegP family protein [Cyclobacteriaceae bacterium]|jgi:hypothetical protein|nr:YegP family protein [Cyclobacteriaceae bacterium]
MGKFVITQRTNNDYQFNLKAGNHQVILTSEGYSSMDACKNGVESVIKNGLNDDSFERKESKNGKAYFNLKAGNGQIIGKSEMYESTAAMENGIESVKKNVVGASLENQS